MGIISVEKIACLLTVRGESLKALCNDKIQSIENEYHVQLPIEYKAFLKLMGKGAGNFMLGSSVFLDEIFDIKLHILKQVRVMTLLFIISQKVKGGKILC